MNKFLVVLACLLWIDGLLAQSVDFAPVGAKWYINQIVLEPIPADSFIIVEVTGEEVKAGQLCRVIENLSGCGLPNPAHLFSRNDSVFFYSAVTNEFELLYDYTAQVGSKWTVKGLSIYGGKDVQVEVTNVFPWAFGADTLQAMTIKTNPSYIWGLYILEKIGGRDYLSPTDTEDCGIGPGLYMPNVIRCYEEDGKTYNFNPEFECDFYKDISSTSDVTSGHHITVVPNPARDIVRISGWAEPGIWSLVDMNGRNVLEIFCNDGGTFQEAGNLSSYLPGMYHWHFISLDGRSMTSGVLVIAP